MTQKVINNKIKFFCRYHGSIFIFGLFALFFMCGTEVFAINESDITPYSILAQINKERVRMGLDLLKIDTSLQIAAEDKAFDMVQRGYFSHSDPQGNAPWMWIENAGYKHSHAGENLAIGFVKAKNQHVAWMNSEFHRRNILNSRYSDTGIAVISGSIRGNHETVVVQFFGHPFTRLIDTVPQKINTTIVRGAQFPAEISIKENNLAESALNGVYLQTSHNFQTHMHSLRTMGIYLLTSADLWHAILMTLLIVQFSVSLAIASRIYMRIYKHVGTIDLRDGMM